MADDGFVDENWGIREESEIAENAMEVLCIPHKNGVKGCEIADIVHNFSLTANESSFGANFGFNASTKASTSDSEHAADMLCGRQHGEFSDDFKDLCSGNGESSRKKRRTDRYDSAESSDSGVALLSSTDCSNSSGRSDITEPGSPYARSPDLLLSSSGSESDDSRTASPASWRRDVVEILPEDPPDPGASTPLVCCECRARGVQMRLADAPSLPTASAAPAPLEPPTEQDETTNSTASTSPSPSPPPSPFPPEIISGPPSNLPILTAPRTIRFPAAPPDKPPPEPSQGACKWRDCTHEFDCNSKLLEHIQTRHVNTQVAGEHFECLWVGCKVFARPSCSRSWLERHVLGHGGNKPFRCIVDGCGQRFSSQSTLERHVNSHFNNSSVGPGSAGPKSKPDSTPNKLIRRNGKKLRYRRRPWTARKFDYFDAGIMERLQHRLIHQTQQQVQGRVTISGNSIVLHSQVIARRVEPNGKTKVLLHWRPPEVLPDEWVFESEIRTEHTVHFPSIPTSSLCSLEKTSMGPPRTIPRRRKQGRCT